MKPLAIWIKCNGEAHTNPFIDNCGICMPYWEEYPTCPMCNRKIINSRTGWCKTCKKYIDMRK